MELHFSNLTIIFQIFVEPYHKMNLEDENIQKNLKGRQNENAFLTDLSSNSY